MFQQLLYQLKIIQNYYPNEKNGFKRSICWNKYLAKLELLAQNANLNHLIEPRFQGVKRLFVLAFENDDQKIIDKR